MKASPERMFYYGYLMGKYNNKRLNGQALLDVPFESVTHNPMDLEEAKVQYKEFQRLNVTGLWINPLEKDK